MPTENRSSAAKCRADSKPLLYAVSHFALWRQSKDKQAITFIFADGSRVSFIASAKPQESAS